METATFGALNYGILACYLAAMLGIGLFFARRQEDGEMFFLGGRKLPWLAVAMSMYASLTSAVTYLVIPGTAYSSNISLVIVCLVSPVVAPCILLLFYPLYHRLGVTTSYEYIEKRFGKAAHRSVAGLFVLARLGWLGTVVYAPAMAMAVVTGIPLWACICMMGLLATAYTALGGLSAVVWTDVVQFVILVGGAIWLAASLSHGVEGGAGQVVAAARDTGRLHIVDWRLDLHALSGPVVAISYFIQMLQDYGTDQVTVQRLLATGSLRKTVKSVAFNACTDFCLIGLLLFIGLGLFAFFRQHGMPEGMPPDEAMPYYIIHHLPAGISGLLITAIFAAAMSSMDSGINSIATVLIKDFTTTPRGPRFSEVTMARILTVVLGGLATAVAFYVSSIGSLLKAFLSFMGMFSVPVLVLFLLGTLSRRGNFRGWLAGTAASIALSLWLQKGTEVHEIYYIPFSFAACLFVTALASQFFKTEPAPRDLTVWKS